MKKLVTRKLILDAGKATANPPVGPILGQYGVNINLFCREYNKLTQPYIGLKIPVYISISGPKTFNIKITSPSVSSLISLLSVNNKITLFNFKKILKLKQKENYPISIQNCLSMVKGTLKSMHVNIEY